MNGEVIVSQQAQSKSLFFFVLQGITFKRVGVPTSNDIIKSSSKDAVRLVVKNYFGFF